MNNTLVVCVSFYVEGKFVLHTLALAFTRIVYRNSFIHIPVQVSPASQSTHPDCSGNGQQCDDEVNAFGMHKGYGSLRWNVTVPKGLRSRKLCFMWALISRPTPCSWGRAGQRGRLFFSYMRHSAIVYYYYYYFLNITEMLLFFCSRNVWLAVVRPWSKVSASLILVVLYTCHLPHHDFWGPVAFCFPDRHVWCLPRYFIFKYYEVVAHTAEPAICPCLWGLLFDCSCDAHRNAWYLRVWNNMPCFLSCERQDEEREIYVS